MPALPQNILTSLTNIPQVERLAKAYLDPVDMAPAEEQAPWNDSGGNAGNAIAFQYWPESVQDSRSSEWTPRPIPGGSHPIYQWTNGGERRISFTAMFSTDTRPSEENIELADSVRNFDLNEMRDPYEFQSGEPIDGLERGVRDIDLRAVVSWLRWYTYPYYDEQNWRAYEPAKVLLVMPNVAMGYDGSDSVLSVMTQCDVTYEEFFPSGFPRLIEVALEFAETVQRGSRVQFHDRRIMGQSGYLRNVASYLAVKANERR